MEQISGRHVHPRAIGDPVTTVTVVTYNCHVVPKTKTTDSNELLVIFLQNSYIYIYTSSHKGVLNGG